MLLYIILAVTFIEVKILLYCAIKIIIQNNKPLEFSIPKQEEEGLNLAPKSYSELTQKLRSII